MPDGSSSPVDRGRRWYFALNRVGVRIWELLPPKSVTLEDVCSALAAQFPEVEPSRIETDVRRLLEDLSASRLVIPQPASVSDDQASPSGDTSTYATSLSWPRHSSS